MKDKSSITSAIELTQRFTTERPLSGKIAILVFVIAAAFSTFHIINGSRAGLMSMDIVRSVHLAFALCLSFLIFSYRKKNRGNKVPIYDMILAIVGTYVALYITLNWSALLHRAAVGYTTMDYVISGLGIAFLLEATRRVINPALVIIAILFILYAKFGSIIPGPLSCPEYSWKQVLEHLYLTKEGIFGIPLTVSAQFVVLFIVFGAFLAKTGAGKFFIDFAFALTGRGVGGPAKAAVVSSALMGTVSGSSVANTTTTGVFTIPLMKKVGYKPEFAGGVEPAASTGGQIMPPIMGAAAFVMAEFLGVPYTRIILAGIFPAILYFVGVYIAVDFEARKTGLRGLSKEETPNIIEVIKSGWYYVIPIFLIIYLLVTGYTPMLAVVYSIFSVILIFIIKSIYDNLRRPREEKLTANQLTKHIAVTFVNALSDGGKGTITVALACASAGIIVGVVTLTGLGFKIGALALSISGGYLLPILFLTMIASLLLGMGVPTTANYIITATVAAPAILIFMAAQAGLPMREFLALNPEAALPAHMFAFFFGVAADITPPVALAAYAGSAIAGSEPMKTAVNAFKIGIGQYIIPFIFIYTPVLLFCGLGSSQSILHLAAILLFSVLAIVAINGGTIGYLITNCNKLTRILCLISAALLISPQIAVKLAGLGLLGGIAFLQWRKRKVSKATAPPKLEEGY